MFTSTTTSFSASHNAPFIAQHIRRTNRNLLLLAVLAFAAAAIGVTAEFRFYYNLLFGPFVANTAELTHARTPEDLFRYHLSIESDTAFVVGTQSLIEHSLVAGVAPTNQGVVADLVAMKVGDRWLLIGAPTSHGSQPAQHRYAGVIEQIPDGVQRKIIDAFVADNPELQGKFLPVMLWSLFILEPIDYLKIAGIAALLMVGVSLSLLAVWRTIKPTSHPIMTHTLARFPQPDAVLRQIEGELAVGLRVSRIGPVTMTPSWLLNRTFLGLDIVPTNEIIGIRKRRGRGRLRIALISYGQAKPARIQASKAVLDQLIQEIAQRTGGRGEEVRRR
jgi:hypothetical protein